MKKVMVVEDNEELRNVLTFMLKRMQYEVTEAENGKDAIEKLSISKPNLVLCDIAMPICDGFQFIESLSKINSSVPVLFMTGHTFGDVEKLKSYSNYAGLLLKPMEPDDLSSKISDIINQ